MSVYAIAQITKQHETLVSYHIKKLEAEKIVQKNKDGYVLVPILYDPKLIDAVYAVLTPFVSDTAAGCESPELVLAVLQVSLELFLSDLKPKKILTHK